MGKMIFSFVLVFLNNYPDISSICLAFVNIVLGFLCFRIDPFIDKFEKYRYIV